MIITKKDKISTLEYLIKKYPEKKFLKNILKTYEDQKFKHMCLNCNSNYCLNDINPTCVFCKKRLVVITKNKIDYS
jgi:hypothetical protein